MIFSIQEQEYILNILKIKFISLQALRFNPKIKKKMLYQEDIFRAILNISE